MAEAAAHVSWRWAPDGRFTAVVADTLKVGVVAWGVVAFEPALSDILPTWDPVARYFLAAVVGALILELLLAIVFGVPRLQISWAAAKDPVAVSQIVVRPSARQRGVGLFQLKIIIPTVSVLGMLAIRSLMRLRPTLAIRMDTAPMTPEVKSSRIRKSAATVTANNDTHGFDVYLGDALSRPGEWHWATVTWTCDEIHDDITCNIDYRWVHKHWWVRVLLWLTIRRPTNVRDVRMIRK